MTSRPLSIGIVSPGPRSSLSGNGVTARRWERLLEELSFEAPDMKMGRVEVNAAYVRDRLDDIAKDEDLSKFIL